MVLLPELQELVVSQQVLNAGPLEGIHLQTLLHEIYKQRTPVLRLSQVLGRLPGDRHESSHGPHGSVGRLAFCQLDGSYTKTSYICLVSVAVLLYDFRSHSIRSPYLALPFAACLCQLSRDSEVSDFDYPLRIHQYVSCFDVSVDLPALVHVLDSFADSIQDSRYLDFSEGFSSDSHHVAEAPDRAVFHEHPEVPVLVV